MSASVIPRFGVLPENDRIVHSSGKHLACGID